MERNIRDSIKKIIFEGRQRSTLTYSVKFWVMNKKDQQEISESEMECWRKDCGLIRSNKISNEEIRRTTKDVIEYIEKGVFIMVWIPQRS